VELDAVGCSFERRNAMVRSQRGDALAGPTIAVAGFETVAIEKASDQVVAGDQRQLRTASMISAGVLLRCPRLRLGNRISL
jgi:hypothetical protein